MAAILRVKRRRNEDPVESLVLRCKRFKSTSGNEKETNVDAESVKSLFKFAATVSETDSATVAVKDAIRKEKLKKEYKTLGTLHQPLQVKSRAAKKKATDSSRYRIISERRALNIDGLEAADQQNSSTELSAGDAGASADQSLLGDVQLQQQFRLYDVVTEPTHIQAPGQGLAAPPTLAATTAQPEIVTCNGIPMVRQQVSVPRQSLPDAPAVVNSDDSYVYDLYYMNQGGFDFRDLEHIIAVEAFENDLVYNDYRGGRNEEVYDDSDDSNDEGNWRNDYPDEDPRFFENAEADYCYGDDGNNPVTAFGDDYGGLADQIERGLMMDDPEDNYFEDDASTDDDLNDEDGEARNKMKSFESYKMRMMREMAADEADPKEVAACDGTGIVKGEDT